MKAIQVNLPSGQTLHFREGEHNVRDIDEQTDDYSVTEVENVIVSFTPDGGADDEMGEPRIKFSKRLCTVVD